jgi:hypothetical protein
MKQLDKKLWIRPELTVLVRNKPEESVSLLTICKTFGQGFGPFIGKCNQSPSDDSDNPTPTAKQCSENSKS